MLFLLFGSSAAGKTYALNALRVREPPSLAIHDFDEVGIPPHSTRRFRHEANESWLQRALDHQSRGTDLLLAGQTPFGELLATPSAPLLNAISGCLLDCDDGTRTARLHERGEDWWSRSSGSLSDYLSWAAWMRRHAKDPQWMREVIRDQDDAAPGMRWDRWSDWRAGDPRWRVRLLDASRLPVEQIADELLAWIAEERALVGERKHPLLSWDSASMPFSRTAEP